MKDDRLINVDEEVRRTMREFGDAIFEVTKLSETNSEPPLPAILILSLLQRLTICVGH